eukprot:1188893-Prorocentrum_minimum.AAC.2
MCDNTTVTLLLLLLLLLLLCATTAAFARRVDMSERAAAGRGAAAGDGSTSGICDLVTHHLSCSALTATAPCLAEGWRGPPSCPARGLAPCRPPPPGSPSLAVVRFMTTAHSRLRSSAPGGSCPGTPRRERHDPSTCVWLKHGTLLR